MTDFYLSRFTTLELFTAQRFAGLYLMAVQKLICRHTFFAFHLYLVQHKNVAIGGGYGKMVFTHEHSSWLCSRTCSRKMHPMHDQLLAAQRSPGPGPGLKSTIAVIDLLR